MTKLDKRNSFRNGPDERGHFGIFGGRFVAETLMPLVLSLDAGLQGGQGRPELSKPSSTICSSTTWGGRARSISPSG